MSVVVNWNCSDGSSARDNIISNSSEDFTTNGVVSVIKASQLSNLALHVTLTPSFSKNTLVVVLKDPNHPDFFKVIALTVIFSSVAVNLIFQKDINQAFGIES
jgi:hypothetical protein